MTSPPLHHKESPLFRADRATYWRHLRELGPVVRIGTGKPSLRGYYLTRRDDVRAALLDPETFVSPPKTFKLAWGGVPLPQVPLSCATPEEHARFARVLHPMFSPKALAPYAPVLRAEATSLITRVADDGQCDATIVADDYACQAMCTVCGMPGKRPSGLIHAAVIGDSTGAAELQLVKWLNSQLGAAIGNPQRPPGILWPLVEGLGANNGFPLSRFEVTAVILLLFSVAGIEMVAAAICFALLRLALDPRMQARLREDPTQIPAFVEEILRLEAPGPAIPRITTRDVNIGGVTIPAESSVWLALEAAGRENGGDEISMTGDGKIRRQRHWAFGSGMHRCLGLYLARLEIVAFLSDWLSRIPQFELQAGSAPAIVHKPVGVTHLDSLMLRWEAQ